MISIRQAYELRVTDMIVLADTRLYRPIEIDDVHRRRRVSDPVKHWSADTYLPNVGAHHCLRSRSYTLISLAGFPATAE